MCAKLVQHGRFITADGTKNLDLLDALNDPRFLFHSAAPLLCLTGLDLGQRLGVGWASNVWVEGITALACTAVVALSTLRNTLLLQTRPTWSGGVFHFTYNDAGFDFTRIIPVGLTTVLLTALGVSAALEDPSQWAVAAGPAACLALSAGIIPRSVAPMILTGNAGEVMLIASLVATEAGLLGQKLL
ncbi:glycosyl transferase family 1 [Micractinium conductrix]|uniref:Glycosyl transferase family 1 n=1 Tax=Micractinium conductrix TaxID=554055 RepID=A0A2P6VIE7_9CHLO|nr:glycosyl transferase family 1 [Micractinium conductrix]|eukprot:PSC73837.1 glycosyl transferase family 1 [Micractinium conductrix]